MIGFLRGAVAALDDDACLLDVNGVGYRVGISAATRERLAVGSTVTLHTHFALKENDVALYGFDRRPDYDLFRQLITVKGVGPALALNMLSGSATAAEDIARAIALQDAAALTKMPGIGKKTAARLLLELKDKLSVPEGAALATGATVASGAADVPGDALSEAGAALASLGYAQSEYAPALRRAVADAPSTDVATLVRNALRLLASA